MSRLRSLSSHLIGGAALLALAVLPAAATAAPGPIKGEASGLCASVPGDSSITTLPIVLHGCVPNPGRIWELTASGQLRTLSGTRCLDPRLGGTAPGTWLISFNCHAGDTQRWAATTDGSLRNVASNLCVEAWKRKTASGTPLLLAPCNGEPSQKFSVPTVSGSGGGSGAGALTPPGQPTIAALTCRNAALAWTASTGDADVAFYDVFHDGQLMKSVSGTTLRTVVPVTAGATWGFYVNARDAAGNVSQASPTQRVTIPQCSIDGTPPSVPTGLSATVQGTAATLSWTASTDDIAVSTYDVYRGDEKVGSTAATTFTDSGLASGATYTYSVVARDAQDNASARSQSVQVTAGAGCSTAVCSARQITTDNQLPWGVVELPDGTALYTRRDSHDVVKLDLTTGAKTNLGVVPNVQSTDGEGGLLGVAVTPQFPATDPWIYLMHTSPTDNRVVRMKLSGGTLDDASLQVLVSGIGRNKFHNGGRLRFGPDGKLYISTGDAQNGAYAQDVNNLAGKILRINPDGSRPSDNPFGNIVWSFGHRNPQGLAFDSQGRLWEQEFGNSRLDETNLIQKGGNYGWPACEGTISVTGEGCATAGFIEPKRTYPVSVASCSGIAIVRDALYVGCQRGSRVYRHVISGSSLTGTQELFAGTYGRIRTLEPTRDGGLLLTTTNGFGSERIVKVTLGG